MIIGISGKAGAGKDTVGKIIQYLIIKNNQDILRETKFPNLVGTVSFKEYDKSNLDSLSNWNIKKFANKVKDIVCLMINCTREQLEDEDFKNTELGEEWEIPLKEYWVDIPIYKGLYKISSFGKIKSLDRITNDGKNIKGKIISLHIGTTGYPSCTLSKNGKKKTESVHQLMVRSFLNYRPDNYTCVVNHIDENKTNNMLTNLEVVSSRYNTQYSKSTKGVYKRNNKFEVSIRINTKKTYLGTFDTEKKALEIRNKKLKEIDTFTPIKYISKQWTPRLLLQNIGTNIGRNIIHPNIWVNALMSTYKPVLNVKHKLAGENGTTEDYEPHEDDIISNYPNWIITDLRFENELKAIKDRGGITIRVNRYCYDSAEDFLVCHPKKEISKIGIDINMNKNSSVIDFEEPARIHGYVPLKEQHPSETALDNAEFDYTINNNGTIEELVEQVKQILIKEKIL
jgi:hypothetical protein